MKRLYAASAYDPRPDPGNFWDSTAPIDTTPCPSLRGDAAADVAVIGAGYTGLAAARALASDYGLSVRVLEAACPGWGASGRNGGFVCVGGAKLSYPAMIRRYGIDATRDFFKAQCEAVDLVASTIDGCGLTVDRHSRGEWQLAHRPGVFGALVEEATFLKATFGVDAAVHSREQLRELGMAGPEFHGGLHLPVGFALNPRKYLNGLLKAATEAGVVVHGNTPALRLRHERGRHVVETAGGTVTAARLIVATNGYSADGWIDWLSGRYLPVISNIIVTRPLDAAERAAQGWTSDQMAYDARDLLHYFRLMPDGRFLFGMRGGTSLSSGAVRRARARIRRDFERMFPAWRHVETPHGWSGLACLAGHRVMYVGPIGDLANAWTGFAFHGNGVSMGTYAGHALARLAAGRATIADLPAIVTRTPPRFPLASLRLNYLRAAYAFYHLKD